MQKNFIRIERILFYTLVVSTLIVQLTFGFLFLPYGLYTLLIPWAIARIFYFAFSARLGKRNTLLVIALIIFGGLIAIYSQNFIPLGRFVERSKQYPTDIKTLGAVKNPSIYLMPHLACTPECIDLLIDGKFSFVETKDPSAIAGADNGITRWKLVRDKAYCWLPKKLARRDDFFDAAQLWLLAQGACIVGEHDTVSKAKFYYKADRKIQSKEEELTVETIAQSESNDVVSQNTFEYVTVVAFPPSYRPTSCSGYAGVSVCNGPMKFHTTLWQTKPYIDTHEFIHQTLGASIKHRIYSQQFKRALLDNTEQFILEAADSNRDDLRRSVAALVCSMEATPNIDQKLLEQLREKNYTCKRPDQLM